jgi:hypothetical protein
MNRWPAWFAFTVVLACAGACGDGETGTTSPRPSSTAPSFDYDLATFDLVDLIYWDTLLFSGATVPPGPLERLVVAMGESGDPRYEPYLVELALYPTPYRDAAAQALVGDANAGVGDILDYLGERGRKEPDDDDAMFVKFKQRLMGTIIPDFFDFLDPGDDRTISAQEVVWGGVATDGIPPLEEPNFVTPEQASAWIVPSDQVIGVEINGDVRAYPRRIIDWHEMVNDTVGGVPVSLAYCTLCGSAILYDGRLGGEVYRFGTSGMLYRSNKLMYDRLTRSLWEQYTGEPVWGPLVGKGLRLNVLPVVHTNWAEWLAMHPETKVLDINTGFSRDYGSGVAYADYWASTELMFPAPDLQGPLHPKDYVYAVRVGDEVVAFPIATLRERLFVQDEIEDTPVVVIVTADGSGGRAYAAGDATFTVADPKSGILVDEGGRTWRITEDALIADDGATLERLAGHNSFWFAVINHAPRWRLYE